MFAELDAARQEAVQKRIVFRYSERVELLNSHETGALEEEALSALVRAGVPVTPTRRGFIAIGAKGGERLLEVRLAGDLATADFDALSRERDVLWLAERVADDIAVALRARGIHYADASGNVFVTGPGGLYVSVQGKTGRRIEFEPLRLTWDVERDEGDPSGARRRFAQAYGWAGMPVVLALLVRPELCRASVREIASVVPSSIGTVHRVVTALAENGDITRGEAGALVHPRVILDRFTDVWLTKMIARSRRTSRRFAPGLDPRQLRPEQLSALGVEASGEYAVDLQGYSLRSVTALLYADEPRSIPLVKQLRLRADPLGKLEVRERLWLPEIVAGPWAPAPVIRADLLALDDPRTDEIAADMLVNDPVLKRLSGGGPVGGP